MKIKVLCLLFGISFLLFSTFAVWAVTYKTETFALTGGGSFMDSPPIWSGNTTSGTLYPGQYWISMDDGGWPVDNPGTPENERWDFIFSSYFTYDDTEGNEGWDGKWPSSVLGDDAPQWRMYTAAGDTLGGLCSSFRVVIRDYDADGILDASEYQTKSFSIGFVCYINFGRGCYANFCGMGNCSGTLKLLDEGSMLEELYVPSPISPSGRLYLRDTNCVTGTSSASWGSIKTIYQD